jgi:hypothetical protein
VVEDEVWSEGSQDSLENVLHLLPRAAWAALQSVRMQPAACGMRSPTQDESVVQLGGCASAGRDLRGRVGLHGDGTCPRAADMIDAVSERRRGRGVGRCTAPCCLRWCAAAAAATVRQHRGPAMRRERRRQSATAASARRMSAAVGHVMSSATAASAAATRSASPCRTFTSAPNAAVRVSNSFIHYM